MQTRMTSQPTFYFILIIISVVHLFNDSIQAVIPAIFPILKESMQLSFIQVGLIGFVINFTSFMMQPVVGVFSDRKPSPFLLPLGMMSSFCGMLLLAVAPNYYTVLVAVTLVGIGSAVFHPEASRVAYLAAGHRRGLAQSIFQVGGNTGQALAPFLTIIIFIPLGQIGALWFTLVAGVATLLLLIVARWYKQRLTIFKPMIEQKEQTLKDQHHDNQDHVSTEDGKQPLLSHRGKTMAMTLLLLLVFVRSWYHVGMTNYYPFYLMDRYQIGLDQAQIFILLFLSFGALGTFIGGPLSDRFGRRNIIFISIVGVAPFSILIPHVSMGVAYVLISITGLIILSSFSVTVVYAQELFPGKIGTVSGLVIGLAFGMGAVGALLLGVIADYASLQLVMVFCGLLPVLGVLTLWLPADRREA